MPTLEGPTLTLAVTAFLGGMTFALMQVLAKPKAETPPTEVTVRLGEVLDKLRTTMKSLSDLTAEAGQLAEAKTREVAGLTAAAAKLQLKNQVLRNQTPAAVQEYEKMLAERDSKIFRHELAFFFGGVILTVAVSAVLRALFGIG
jgi:hypothetical protein